MTPAFPTESEHQSGPNTYHYEGMTIRDYFAAKAMAAYIGLSSDGYGDEARGSSAKAAEWAYMHADAMMKERLKP